MALELLVGDLVLVRLLVPLLTLLLHLDKELGILLALEALELLLGLVELGGQEGDLHLLGIAVLGDGLELGFLGEGMR